MRWRVRWNILEAKVDRWWVVWSSGGGMVWEGREKRGSGFGILLGCWAGVRLGQGEEVDQGVHGPGQGWVGFVFGLGLVWFVVIIRSVWFIEITQGPKM